MENKQGMKAKQGMTAQDIVEVIEGWLDYEKRMTDLHIEHGDMEAARNSIRNWLELSIVLDDIAE